MIVYYENMNGEKLNLLKAPFRTTKTDWFDADWSESSDGYEKTVTIDVFGKREEFQANMEPLYRIIAVAAENDTYVKLYVFKMQGIEVGKRRMEGVCVFGSGDHLPGSGACMGSRSDKAVFSTIGRNGSIRNRLSV